MAKIGTAQIEIKPVLNEDALNAMIQRISQQVEDAVAAGVDRGMSKRQEP